MGRKTQISKETMLQAAYEILRDEGYLSVNIKAIAAKVGCSTQPISWQFGNMPGLRAELFTYATDRIFGNIEDRIKGMNAIEAFFETGKLYVSTAIDYPNIFRFLCVDDNFDLKEKNSNILELLGDDFIKEMLVKELRVSREIISQLCADIIIYTHGLAVILLWENAKLDRDTAYEMVFNNAKRVFLQQGIDVMKYIS